MRLTILATLVVAGLAVPVTAKEKKPVDPNRKVCRKEQVTGSMFGKSICHTVAEWQAIDEANRRSTDAFEDKKGNGGIRP